MEFDKGTEDLATAYMDTLYPYGPLAVGTRWAANAVRYCYVKYPTLTYVFFGNDSHEQRRQLDSAHNYSI